MNASGVVAICATVIAVLSLAVSVYEARATRRHNRKACARSSNCGSACARAARQASSSSTPASGRRLSPGPILTLDGISLGEYGEESVNVFRGKFSVRPAAATFRKTVLATDYDQFLLSIEPFDRNGHAEFADLLRHRLGLEIHYESLYGGEDYKTERNPHP